MTRDEYLDLRSRILVLGYDEDYRWANNVPRPDSPEHFAAEYVWVVLNSGMKNQIARQIYRRVMPVLERGGSAGEVFGHRGKAEAIDEVWRGRVEYFHMFLRADDEVSFCESLPWIGGITKFHLAKNLGVDCAKPDRHLERVARAAGESVDDLCARLARETGDRVAAVDYVIWRACNLGLLRPAA